MYCNRRTYTFVVFLASVITQAVGQEPCKWIRPLVSDADHCNLVPALASVEEVPVVQPSSFVSTGAPAGFSVSIRPAASEQRFQWRPALQQSVNFLAIQHGFRLATGYWTRYELRNGKFLHEWMGAVRQTNFSRWDDGDDVLSNYVGHPLQGAVTGYIQIHNDPQGRAQKIGASRAYWKSRLKATAWAAAYSAQFEIGPLSEASIGNLGNFKYMENGRVTNGTGLVDFVATPIIGLGWIVTEDALDRFVSDRVERRRKTALTRILRSALTPSRTMANVLRWRVPWHRDAPVEAGRVP